MSNIQKTVSQERKLLILLDHVTIDDMPRFMEVNGQNLKAMITSMCMGLDLPTAHASPKLFNLRTKFGKGTVIKLLCAVLKSFCESIKASRTMDAIDIVECAELLEEKYSHDSVKDIMLALKQAKLKGTKFYNAIDASVIMAICEEYFDAKSAWLEKKHEEEKNAHANTRTEADKLMIAMQEGAEKKEKEIERQRRLKTLELQEQRERIRLEVLKQQGQ